MPLSTLITASQLERRLANPDLAVVDCRFTLADPESGRHDYQTAHIPAAVYAHLNEDLSAPVVQGVTGRHPLPAPEAAARLFSSLGIGPGVQVVAYDDAGGALAAARLWWLLRWLGHTSVAVLDGGFRRWQSDGRPVRAGIETRPPRTFTPRLRTDLTVTTDEVERLRQDPAWRLLDARSADRFRGENETIDPVAGHIPGAVSAPFGDNLTPECSLRPAKELRAHYQGLLGGLPTDQAVVYCGSGVTAAHDVLAIQYAGLGEAKLYPGSWSEWITDPRRPLEK